MAVDKLVDSTQLNSDLTSVANAIRTKGGTSGSLAFPAGFVSAVQAIPTGTTPTGTKQISITQNGTTTEDVAAYANAEITVNVSGGGSGNSETGTITLASDFGLSTNPQPIPGLQLGFVPDYFLMLQTRDSFESRTEGLTGGLWGLEIMGRAWSPPFANNANSTPESAESDYTFFLCTNLLANSSLVNGYGYPGLSPLVPGYYSRFAVNNDGTISVGRYSSASTVLKSGTYRYFAMKI